MFKPHRGSRGNVSQVRKRTTNTTKRAKPGDPEYFADPAHSMGYLSRVAFRRFAKALENRTLTHGISSGQWRFLRVLWVEDGITQRELSRRVDMREPTTVVALRGLEKNGFVRRVRDQEDRRRIRVHLTDKAKSLHDKLIPSVAAVNAIASKGLSRSEIETARRVLAVMAENLAPEVDKHDR